MTELLYGIAIAPFKDMVGSPAFFAEVLIGGVFAGLMYSLVALGFVLIFKASGVFNFAQGVMVLFAALTLVGLLERGVPVVGALLGTTAVMVALAWVIERVVLRPLVNQRSEEHTSELQSQSNLVCRLLLEKKKTKLSVSP